MKRLDGGLEMLRSGKTAEEVLQAYSRHALVKALAEMRAKTLQSHASAACAKGRRGVSASGVRGRTPVPERWWARGRGDWMCFRKECSVTKARPI